MTDQGISLKAWHGYTTMERVIFESYAIAWMKTFRQLAKGISSIALQTKPCKLIRKSSGQCLLLKLGVDTNCNYSLHS